MTEPQGAAVAGAPAVVDAHIDAPYRVHLRGEDLSQRTERGDFDHPRARAGGLAGAFMVAFVPPTAQRDGGARGLADRMLDLVEGWVADHPSCFAAARCADDVLAARETGVVALPVAIENGAALEGKLDNLHHFHGRGVGYLTLTHAADNDLCDSSFDGGRRWNGLSPLGRAVVREMNALGMMVDVSHASDAAFWDVLEVAEAPVIASHSSCRAFTPGWERNLDDAMIRALAATGGVAHVNFGSAFLTESARRSFMAMVEAANAHLEARGLPPLHPDGEAFMARYLEEHPPVYADLGDVVAHIEHALELVGEDHVGIGSDFDGVGDSLPIGLKDVAAYPALGAALRVRGHAEGVVGKVMGGNLLRVWRQVAAAARG